MKGTAIIWLNILAGIFFVALVYIIWSQVIYVYIKPIVVPAIENMNGTYNTTSALNTIALIDIVWQYWPLILIFGLILYGFVAAQRREPDQYYY